MILRVSHKLIGLHIRKSFKLAQNIGFEDYLKYFYLILYYIFIEPSFKVIFLKAKLYPGFPPLTWVLTKAEAVSQMAKYSTEGKMFIKIENLFIHELVNY